MLQPLRPRRLRTHLTEFGRCAWLEDDDCRLSRASGCVAVEVVVQFTPALPKPFTLRANCVSAEHLAPDSACQLDDRLRIGLQVQPPGWLGRAPAVHGHRDEVGAVLVVAEDHAPRLAAASTCRGDPQGPPLTRARSPQPSAAAARSHDPSVHVPGGLDEPSWW